MEKIATWIKIVSTLIGIGIAYATLQSQVSYNTKDIAKQGQDISEYKTNAKMFEKDLAQELKNITEVLHGIDKRTTRIETQIQMQRVGRTSNRLFYERGRKTID